MNNAEKYDMPNVNVDVDVDKINKRIKQALADEKRKKRDDEALAELDEILGKLKKRNREFRMNPSDN